MFVLASAAAGSAHRGNLFHATTDPERVSRKEFACQQICIRYNVLQVPMRVAITRPWTL